MYSGLLGHQNLFTAFVTLVSPTFVTNQQNCKNLDPNTKVCSSVGGQIGTWSGTGTGELGTVKFSM